MIILSTLLLMFMAVLYLMDTASAALGFLLGTSAAWVVALTIIDRFQRRMLLKAQAWAQFGEEIRPSSPNLANTYNLCAVELARLVSGEDS